MYLQLQWKLLTAKAKSRMRHFSRQNLSSWNEKKNILWKKLILQVAPETRMNNNCTTDIQLQNPWCGNLADKTWADKRKSDNSILTNNFVSIAYYWEKKKIRLEPQTLRCKHNGVTGDGATRKATGLLEDVTRICKSSLREKSKN